MAFPTSPSNNDIHKEGNRAWVYDSTLSVWNQVPEFDTYPFGEPPNLTNTLHTREPTPSAGQVIGVWSNFSHNSSPIDTVNTGGQVSNPDGLTGAPPFSTAHRVFAKVESVTVNVSSTSSDLFVIGTLGLGNMNFSNKGAYGMVLNIPNAAGANIAYDTNTYPHYPVKQSHGANSSNSGYAVGMTEQIIVKGSANLVKSGVYPISIYAFAYNEGSPSGNQNIKTHASNLMVMEIKR